MQKDIENENIPMAEKKKKEMKKNEANKTLDWRNRKND